MAEPAPENTAWRHLYTWARRGSLGRPGYQTVACAAELGEERRQALERLVASARPPEPKGGRPSLLVQPLPTDRGRSVLTRVVPLGATPDGRPGNFWAESLVVPDHWLQAADWDLAAAFGRAEWWGPPAGPEPGDASGEGSGEESRDPVRWLTPEPLPHLAAGPAGRLARLPELLPDREIRVGLLATLAWQAEDGGREEPLHVVAAPGSDAAALEELILLLPLLLPVPRRVRRLAGGHAGERRCLRLATLGEPGLLDRPDLLGVPEAHLESARRAPGVVADLGGNVPPPDPGSDDARRWARRVDEALAAGRWEDALGAGGEHRRVATGGRATMTDETRERPAPSGGAGDGGRDPLAERSAAWALREESEARAADLVRRLRSDVEQLLEPVAALVESERRRFREELERMRREIEDVAEDARRALAGEVDRGRQQLLEEGGRRRDVLHGELATRIEQLDRHHEELLDRLKEEEIRAERRLSEAVASAAAGWRTSRDRVYRDLTGRAPPPEPEEHPVAESGARAGRSAAAGGGLREVVASWPPVYRWGAPVLLLLLLVVAGYLLVGRSGPEAGAGAGDDGGAGVGSTPSPGGGAGAFETDALRARVVSRLRSGPTAAALLRAAVDREPLRTPAASAYLALRLGAAPGLDDATSCVLLQQVLSDRLEARGEAPIGVDGICGPGTFSALAAAAETVGCGGGAWQAQAGCLLNRTFSGDGDPPCAAAWPFHRPCPWSLAAGGRVLETLRRARAAERSRYDLAAAPALAAGVAGRDPAEAEARELLPLAYAAAVLAAGEPLGAVPAPAALDEEALAAALAYLDELPPAPAAGGAAGG